MRVRSLVATILVLFGAATIVHAQTADELRDQIDENNQKIEEIEAEIAQYEEELEVVGAEKQTLQGAVRELDISRNKISSSISATELTIRATELEIFDLVREIEKKQSAIKRNSGALSEALRRVYEADDQSFVEALLHSKKISALWDEVASVQQFQDVLRQHIDELHEAKVIFESAKQDLEGKQDDLEYEKDTLAAQKYSLDLNRRSKNDLLDATKQKESNYQALLEEKREAKRAFEAALLDLESQLKYTLDPDSLPTIGAGILRWPLDRVRVTQYFGNTKFAQSGAYNGSGHNGIDMGASVGTPIRAALGGVVQASGDTDRIRGCYSYGKWMLVRHANGLSTLYAHLSDFAMPEGESVSTGQIIGYTGNTGYSTGPHLHFSVYAADAVQIVRLGDVKKRTNCADARIPIAPLNAYLNPLNYLPELE